MLGLKALTALLVLVAALPAAAQGQEPVVYSSLPLREDVGRDALRGIELALERAGRPVRLVSLDSGTRALPYWTPPRVAENARKAVEDERALAYLGEFASGASAISLPILNDGGLLDAGEREGEANPVLQVSGSATAVGLTRPGPMAERGEPDKYLPSGLRSFGRVIPNDRVQARAAAVMLRDAGVRRVLVVHEAYGPRSVPDDVYGRGLARLLARAARARGIEIVAARRLTWPGRRAGAVAALARRRRADAVFFAGVGDRLAVRLWRALARMPGLQLFGGDGIALPSFLARVPRAAAARTRMTLLPMAPEAYPPAAQEVLAALPPGTGVHALYGYEAMSVVLDALARGGATRKGVREAFFVTRDRDSVLGRYSIDRFGDTSLTGYGVYRGTGGRLVWDHAVDAAAP